MHPLGTTEPVDGPDTAYPVVYSDDPNALHARILARFNTPAVDSLVPVAYPNASATPSNHTQLTTVVVVALVALITLVAITFFSVRYLMRRAAIKRRRQASWILRSGQWNMEPKWTHARDTRTGCSDASSSFSTYPYPLSEHF